MQAAQQNRTRNTDFIQNGNDASEGGAGGDPNGVSNGTGGGEGEDRGGGIGAWFRGLGGGGGGEEESKQDPVASSNYNNNDAGYDYYGSGGGGGGRSIGGAVVTRVAAGSPVETQVQALQEMGFAEVREGGLERRAEGGTRTCVADFCVCMCIRRII